MLVLRMSLANVRYIQIEQADKSANGQHSQIANFMGPTWGPPGFCRAKVGPMLAPWTLL